MKIRVVMCILLLALTSGCLSISLMPPKKDKFPSDIKSLCNGCKNEAERLIKSKGKKLKREVACKVIKVDGQKKFSNIWAWHDPSWNMYVCGLCNGKTIWIACNPHNKQEINAPVLTHEFGHYWLMTALGDNTHNPIYDDCFFNWKRSREVTGRDSYTNTKSFKKYVKKIYDGMEEGEVLSFNQKGTNGTPDLHIDFIVIKEEKK